MANKKELSPKQREELLSTLKARFEKNKNRHKDIEWSKVLAKLNDDDKLRSLYEMENSGGEPDVVVLSTDKKSNGFIFCDCSPESPKERRSFCYDRAALNS